MNISEIKRDQALKSLVLELARSSVRSAAAIKIISASHPENEELALAAKEMSESIGVILDKIGDYFDAK